jgi:hypothetical protein
VALSIRSFFPGRIIPQQVVRALKWPNEYGRSGAAAYTFRLGLSVKAAHPKMNPSEGIGEEAGRETRPTATGTVALPNAFSLPREYIGNVEQPTEMARLQRECRT